MILMITIQNIHKIDKYQTLQKISTYLHCTLHDNTEGSSISVSSTRAFQFFIPYRQNPYLFHCTLLNITQKNFHIYLQHILFCLHLLLYTAGCVYNIHNRFITVISSKQQSLIMLSSTYIYPIM